YAGRLPLGRAPLPFPHAVRGPLTPHSFFADRCFSNQLNSSGITTVSFCFSLKLCPAPSTVTSLHVAFTFSSASLIFLLWLIGTSVSLSPWIIRMGAAFWVALSTGEQSGSSFGSNASGGFSSGIALIWAGGSCTQPR